MKGNTPPENRRNSAMDPLQEIGRPGAESPESLIPSGGPESAGAPPFEVKIVRDWDADAFHRRVLKLESEGYAARRETYRITPEMNPDTGEVLHLHSIELLKPK